MLLEGACLATTWHTMLLATCRLCMCGAVQQSVIIVALGAISTSLVGLLGPIEGCSWVQCTLAPHCLRMHAKPEPFSIWKMLPSFRDCLLMQFEPECVMSSGHRCDIYSTHLKRLGFQRLYTLEGGVQRFLAEQGPRGWDGSLFVFDDRMFISGGPGAAPVSCLSLRQGGVGFCVLDWGPCWRCVVCMVS